MEYKTLLLERTPNACVARINRPHVNNKLSIECMTELVSVLDSMTNDKNCHSVILAGSDDWFCSGGELGDFRAKSIFEIKAFGAAFINLHMAMTRFPKPIIAAVVGDAFGGGFSLVEACDLAVGAETALFACPELLDGLAPAMGISGIFANLGKKEVMSLGLLGTKLTAQQALKCGMLNFVTPKNEVLAKAVELSLFFTDKSPTAIRLFKELYSDLGFMDYERRLRLGQSMMLVLLKSKDCSEVLDAKDDGRMPVWCGE